MHGSIQCKALEDIFFVVDKNGYVVYNSKLGKLKIEVCRLQKNILGLQVMKKICL